MCIGHQCARQSAHEDEGNVEHGKHVGQLKRRLAAQPDVEQGAVQRVIGHQGKRLSHARRRSNDDAPGLLNG